MAFLDQLALCLQRPREQGGFNMMNAATSVLSGVQPVFGRRQLPRRILLVEDEAPVRELLRLHLSLAGFDIEETADGRAALDMARSERFDLIVLDVMVPGLDGITLCRAIRSHSLNTASAVLMLTAHASEADTVLGLESGADDYVTKPFGVREMVARVGAVLRRNERIDAPAASPSPRLVRSRDVTLDPERREARVRGRVVELTRQEFDLLYLLAARPGIVYSRAAVLTKVWTDDTCVTERTVDTVISRLRRKIEHDAQRPELILTAWGVGYKFVDLD
jgi:DNA-binding response OmpR family regulator